MPTEDEQDTTRAAEEFSEVEWLGPCNENEAVGMIQVNGTVSRPRDGKITIYSSLSIPDGLRIHGISVDHKPIELKLSLSQENLLRLLFLFNSQKEALSDALAKAMVSLSDGGLNKGESARGLNKGKEAQLRWLKRDARQLYLLFKALIALDRRPVFFLRLIDEINAHTRKDDFYRDGKRQTIENINPLVLTAYTLEKFRCRTGVCLPSLGVTSFMGKIDELPNAYDDDTRSPFYKNYIHQDRTYNAEKESFPANKSERTAKQEECKSGQDRQITLEKESIGKDEQWYRDPKLTDIELDSRIIEDDQFGEIFDWIFKEEAAPCPREGSACSSRYLRSSHAKTKTAKSSGK